MAGIMDIDMDLDLDIDAVEDFTAHQETALDLHAQSQPFPGNAVPHATSLDDEACQPTPTKVHLRGLDNLTSGDIKAFAAEYFSAGVIEKIEWIDDTSANLVYTTESVAREALNSFSTEDISGITDLPALQMLSAKSFPGHPETRLEVRIAVIGDRKQAGARERSRFYLFNPEYDRADRQRREGRGGGAKRYRDREDGGYRSQVYDEREQRRRQDAEQFDASLYDDDESLLATGAAPRDSSTSSGERGRRSRPSAGKELFPDKARGSGRLRNRSASPTRDNQGDAMLVSDDIIIDRKRTRNDIGSRENRHKAQLLRSTLREAVASAATKELFPKNGAISKRPAFLDATDATADLFSHKMAMYDGGNDSRLLTARVTKPSLGDRISPAGGMSIKGNARPQPQSGISIKGMAAADMVMELFPEKSGNAGKELFGSKLDGRGGQRRRAEDMFR